MVALRAAAVREPLAVQAGVDRVRTGLPGVAVTPELSEADVVLAPAERAGPVPCGVRGCLVEEEQLGEPARLQERGAVPPAEAQPARDPATPGIAPANPAEVVMQTAPVAVHEPAGGVGDELGERRDPVAKRHRGTVAD